MNKNISGKFFVFLCCLIYFTSYMTRNNYNVYVIKIASDQGITEAFASIALTGSFITYGFGQLISGYMGDKIAPRYLIIIGLIATSLCNMLVGFIDNVEMIIVIWCINGFAQALLWPPLVRCMAQELSTNDFKKACALVTAASSVATVLLYIMSPLCLEVFKTWRSSFLISAILGILVCVLWYLYTSTLKSLEPQKVDESVAENESHASVFKILIKTGIIPILIVIVIQGMLRDGIQTWLPKYIKDIFNISETKSIFVSVILPVFSMLSILFTRWFSKFNKTEIHTSVWLLCGALVMCVGVFLFFESQMILSIILMSLLSACMHGINLMLIGDLPARFIKYGKVSLFAGVLNAFTYIGSAVSMFGIALISEHFGWNMTIIIWATLIIAALLLMIYSLKKTKSLFQ